MGRKQFTFYESFYAAIKRIRKPADRCLAYDALVLYALEGVEPENELPDAAAIVFDLCKPNLDAARKKAESGRQGGNKPKANRKQTVSKEEANSKQGESKTEATDKQTVSEKEREKEKEKEYESTPPTPSTEWAEAMASYQEHIQPLPPGIVAQSIRDWCEELEPKLVVRAIEIAAGENVRSWKYINAILQRCKKSGIKTVAAFEAAEAERAKRKEQMANASSHSGEHQGATPGSAKKPKDWGVSYAVSG